MKYAFYVPIILFLGICLSSCNGGPQVTVCVYSSERCEFDCTDKDGKQFVRDCKDPLTDKFEAMPSQDFHELLLWIKNHE